MRRLTRRQVLRAGAVAAALLSVAPRVSRASRRVILSDASGLNPTPMARHRIISASRQDWIEDLRRELASAAKEGRPVAGGAARHSMGGQSLCRDGVALTYQAGGCEPDTAGGTYRVHAGTRWKDVIAALDPIGFSPVVMQSNHDFGVASTFCVNAHGWAVPFGPCGSTVREIDLMLADGTVLTCSRKRNEDLFRLAMGGYGLFGIIVGLEASMTPNQYLEPRFERLPAADFATRMLSHLDQKPAISMAYGRLSVARRDFFEDGYLATFRAIEPPEEGLPAASVGKLFTTLSRKVYRAQIGSETAKRARWVAETVAAPRAMARPVTRNSLLNEPVSNLADDDPRRTDILHEYFIPPKRFPEFLEHCRELIPNSGLECLNVTLRYVGEDPESVLAYAPRRRIAAVLSFSQRQLAEDEAAMLRLTESLIDRVISIGGNFYLPYRLHARPDQIHAAYPRATEFAANKRHYDPGSLFQNTMWRSYFA